MKLPPELRRGDLITGGWISQLIRYLRSITPQPSAEVLVTTTANGTTYAVRKERQAGQDEPRRLPFEVYSVGPFRVRVEGGFIFQSASAHASAKTTLEWTHIPTSIPTDEGGSGPWDIDLAEGDNWIFLSNTLLGENPSSMSPPAASWTTDESETFKGIALAYVYVDEQGAAEVFPYHVGNVFTDICFNLRSSGALVGYHAELAPGASETTLDLAFKLIAGADPIFTLFKGNDNGTWTAIKADYIGMRTDGSVGPEVALSRASGRYSSVKPAYVEMQNDDGTQKIVLNADSEIKIELQGGQPGQGQLVTLKGGPNPEVRVEGPTGQEIVIRGDRVEMTTGGSERVQLLNDGTLTLQDQPGGVQKLTYSPASGLFVSVGADDWFEARGGALSGQSDEKQYTLREIEFLAPDGSAKKVRGYFAEPEAVETPAYAAREVRVCVGTERKTMNVLGTEPS